MSRSARWSPPRQIFGERIIAESKDKNEKDDWLPGHETMALEKEDAEMFFDAILNPRRPNETLRRAMEEHRKRVISR